MRLPRDANSQGSDSQRIGLAAARQRNLAARGERIAAEGIARWSR
jgi:hypothetical protein